MEQLGLAAIREAERPLAEPRFAVERREVKARFQCILVKPLGLSEIQWLCRD